MDVLPFRLGSPRPRVGAVRFSVELSDMHDSIMVKQQAKALRSDRGSETAVAHCTLRGKNGPLAFEFQKITWGPDFHAEIVPTCF